jgi:hypothetical protein
VSVDRLSAVLQRSLLLTLIALPAARPLSLVAMLR